MVKYQWLTKNSGNARATVESAGISETMCPPGATTSGLTKASNVGPADENEASRSSAPSPGVKLSVIAPTVITYGTLPGTPTENGSGPVLPAEVTTTIPACQARMTAWLNGSSQ